MSWPFNFKGMIRPMMAGTFAESDRIAKRKSIPMVVYLRARRVMVDPCEPTWMRERAQKDKASARAAHFRLKVRQT